MGTVSRTARVSGVTRNLKEAAGKAPARRTEIAYEAGISGREGKHLQSPIIIREDMSVDAAGVWSEGHAYYPGRSAVPHRAKSGAGLSGEDDLTFGRSQQRPYEPDSPTGKGLNTVNRTGACSFDDASKGRRPGREAGG
jgi:hypothetical protein